MCGGGWVCVVGWVCEVCVWWWCGFVRCVCGGGGGCVCVVGWVCEVCVWWWGMCVCGGVGL